MKKKRKDAADALDIQEASLMIATIDDNTFTCKSFTNPELFYEVKKEENYVNSCSCPDNIGICKHMFLVSKVMVIPFSLRKSSTVLGAVVAESVD